jgi:hypothetical protein
MAQNDGEDEEEKDIAKFRGLPLKDRLEKSKKLMMKKFKSYLEGEEVI